MSTDNEMVDLIKGAAQEGQLYKISTEEIQSIYQRGSALVKDKPYDEALIKAVNQFKDEIEKRKNKQSTTTLIDDYISLIAKNAGYYVSTFKNFESDRFDKIKATWNWPAFLFGFWWFIYRKLYLWALFAFVVNLMPFCTKMIYDIKTSNILRIVVGFLIMIIWGANANYIYYKHIKKKIAEIDNLHLLKTPRQAELTRTGGVNRIAVVLPLIFATLAVIGIIAAIAIPQFVMFNKRSNCEIARKDAKSAFTVAQVFFAQHPNDNLSDINQLEEFGFKPSKNDKLLIIKGNKDNLIISSDCLGCDKTYYVDNTGVVSDAPPESAIESATASAIASPSTPPQAQTPVIPVTVEPAVSSRTGGSEYASIDDVQAVPYLNDRGKMRYREFLANSKPRAIVIVKDGSFTIAYGGNDPLDAAMQSCRQQSHDDCEPYAVNDKVVWKKSTGSSLPQPAYVKSPVAVSSWAHTKSSNSTPMANETERLLIKPGDTLNDVKNAYHTSAEPEPVKSNTPGATCLRLQDMGIWFFFDNAGKIYVIRLESPFNGTIEGVRIGDSSNKVLMTLGEPDPTKPGRSNGHFYYPRQGLHLLFDSNGTLRNIFLY
ncbi:MAG: DUF2628 domain-containing protein [Smithella sp.]